MSVVSKHEPVSLKMTDAVLILMSFALTILAGRVFSAVAVDNKL